MSAEAQKAKRPGRFTSESAREAAKRSWEVRRANATQATPGAEGEGVTIGVDGSPEPFDPQAVGLTELRRLLRSPKTAESTKAQVAKYLLDYRAHTPVVGKHPALTDLEALTSEQRQLLIAQLR